MAMNARKQAHTKAWWTRVLCLALAALMIGSVAFSAIFSRGW